MIGRLKECDCEVNDSDYSRPLEAYGDIPEIKELIRTGSKYLRIRQCYSCRGFTILEEKKPEPITSDLPQNLFNVVYQRTAGYRNQTLRHFVKQVPKAKFLQQRNVGPKKMAELEAILKDLKIKWK